MEKIGLKEAVRFHGHLGPWLVLGLLMGERAVRDLNAQKHFGIKVNVRGAGKRPKSCLIDGLQLSTGATFGKGNIQKADSKTISVSFRNSRNNKKIRIGINKRLVKQLEGLQGHADSEAFARKLYKDNSSRIFTVTR